ncbi:MAG: hypothetical protein ACK4GJ_05290 [bacterium]
MDHEKLSFYFAISLSSIFIAIFTFVYLVSKKQEHLENKNNITEKKGNIIIDLKFSNKTINNTNSSISLTIYIQIDSINFKKLLSLKENSYKNIKTLIENINPQDPKSQDMETIKEKIEKILTEIFSKLEINPKKLSIELTKN